MIRLTWHYIIWHYGRALRDFANIWRNFLWFFWQVFSVPLLAATFFAPFHRLQERPRPGFHPDEMAQALVVNLLMRLVGMVTRAMLILVAFLMEFLVLVAGALLLLAWLLAPLLLALLFSLGVFFLLI